jgi:hypothetical protein
MTERRHILRGEGMTRQERIEKMFLELRYEIEIGMMQGEIDETLCFEFIVPVSKQIPEGVVFCSFRTRPTHRQVAFGVGMEQPRLRVLK